MSFSESNRRNGYVGRAAQSAARAELHAVNAWADMCARLEARRKAKAAAQAARGGAK